MAVQHKGDEFLVNSQTMWPQLAPKMARLSNGGFVMIWLDFTGDNRGQVFDSNGDRVGSEFVTKGWDVTGLAGGGFVAIWFDDNEVRAQIFDDSGSTVGPSFLANTSTEGNQNVNSIASLESGGFVITWTDHRVSGDADVLGQRFNADGSKLGPEFVVTDDSLAPADQTGSVVMGLADGGFVVAWQEGVDIRAQLYDPSGAKVGGDFLVNDRTSYVDDPRIAALASGGFVIIWTKDINLSGAVDKGVHARIFDSSGAPIGSEFVITTDTPETYGRPDVAALETGGFVVTWASEDADGSGLGVNAQIFDDLGNRVGGEFVANSTTTEDQNQSSVIGLASGDFVIGWTDHSETGGDTSEAAVRAQIFQQAAPVLDSYQRSGGEILANTTVEGGQIGPQMTALASGGYVVTWLDMSNVNRGQVFNSDGGKVGGEIVLGDGWKVAALAHGGFVVMSGDGEHIILQLFDDHGNAAGPPFAAADIVGYPWTIAGLESGGFVVVWDYDRVLAGDGYDPRLSLRGQLFDSNGVPIGDDFAVGDSPGEGNDPETAGLAGGGFVVAWENDGQIEAQLFRSDGAKAGGDFLVGSGEPGMDDPQVAALASGGFVIVWARHGGLDSPVQYRGVFAQIYDSSGAAVGGEIMVSPEGPATGASLDVGAIAGGGFVVTWASATGDGSGTAIRAQVLDGEGNKVGAGLTANTTSGGDQLQPVVAGLASGDFVISWADGSGTGGDTDPFAIRSQLFHAVAPIEGTCGDDVLVGTALEDRILGWSGDDELRGNAGNDLLDGGDGNDVVRGGAGDDVLRVAGLGDDLAAGGTGMDTLVADFSESWTPVISSWGPIANSGQGGFDGGFRDEGWRWLNYTSIERFVVTGGLGDDQLVTADGDDRIDGGAGGDFMAGGRGNDVYVVDSDCDVVEELAGQGKDEVRTGLAVYVLAANVENLYATSDVAHDFRGNAGDNVIVGGDGNDMFRLQDGGFDKAVGGAGNDVFYFGGAFAFRDHVDGGEGARDVLVLQGNYSDRLSSNLIGIEFISLQSGSVTKFGDTANNRYDYNLSWWDSNLAAGAQLVINAQSLLAGEDLTFDGSAESDGSFLIYGGRGKDTLTGGAGNDIFFFEGDRWGANDSVNGGAGRDSLVIAGKNGLNHIEFGNSALTSIESISLNNRFASDPSAVPTYELILRDGNVAAGERMTINGSSLAAGQTLNVDARLELDGAFNMFGGAGADKFIGGAKNDLIYAAGGADTLTGGGGADTFQYRNTADSTLAAADRILDFTSGADKIDLSFIDANANSAGDQAFTFVGGAAFSGAAGELRAVFDAGSNVWNVSGDVNGDGAADFLIVVSTATPAPIVGADFLL